METSTAFARIRRRVATASRASAAGTSCCESMAAFSPVTRSINFINFSRKNFTKSRRMGRASADRSKRCAKPSAKNSNVSGSGCLTKASLSASAVAFPCTDAKPAPDPRVAICCRRLREPCAKRKRQRLAARLIASGCALEAAKSEGKRPLSARHARSRTASACPTAGARVSTMSSPAPPPPPLLPAVLPLGELLRPRATWAACRTMDSARWRRATCSWSTRVWSPPGRAIEAMLSQSSSADVRRQSDATKRSMRWK
mmetsp:Transcript_79620/g.165392  ORF Transcript_79620/g.165392 Transcript_79620/m.165392 type:complete len:257 (-) Transcript_79620:1431-2201(-)